MINVYTVLSTSFNHQKEYVYRLKNSLEKNTTIPFTFTCLTNEQLIGINTVQIENIGAWAKMELCNPLVSHDTDKIYYIDVDTIITGNVDFLISTEQSFMCNTWIGTRRTALMSLNKMERDLVWDFWSENQHRIIKNFKGEGAVYDFVLGDDVQAIQKIYPEKIIDIKQIEDSIPMGCKLVTFMGGKTLKDLSDEHCIKKYW